MKAMHAAWAGLLGMAMLGAAPATGPVGLIGESHQIASAADEGVLLRPRDASSKEGTPIMMYPKEDWKCMTWKFEPAGEDVRLVNYFTHKTFYPAQDGAAVSQHALAKEDLPAEHWRFVDVGEKSYRIEHVASGKVLTISGDGQVTMEKWTGAAGQKWKLLERPGKFTG